MAADDLQLNVTCNICREVRNAVACAHCGHSTCEFCIRQCERCCDVFCDWCSTVNYDARDDRTFCLDCNVAVTQPPTPEPEEAAAASSAHFSFGGGGASDDDATGFVASGFGSGHSSADMDEHRFHSYDDAREAAAESLYRAGGGGGFGSGFGGGFGGGNVAGNANGNGATRPARSPLAAYFSDGSGGSGGSGDRGRTGPAAALSSMDFNY